MNFLKPSKKKVLVFFGLLVFVIAWFWLFFAINERDIAGIVLTPFLSVPFAIFDFITFSYFAPKCDGLIWCFPTVPEILFVFIFDLLLLYIISCVFVAFGGRGKQVKQT